MNTDCVIVLTTVGATADWRSLAVQLVGERLAACVNVFGEMESVYRWKGAVETARERQLVIKTTTQRLPALEARMRELHDYEVPEFIVVSLDGGAAAYLHWIRQSAAG